MKPRIGLLGGTFDPIHFGHLAIAEDARTALGLDRVLFIPAAQQPFKLNRTIASSKHRKTMVELACAGNEGFDVSDIELERQGISYTITTLEHLHALDAGELFFIIGADALVDFPKWHRAAEIPRLAQIVGVYRPGVRIDLDSLVATSPALRNRMSMLEGPQIELSSTEIRRRARLGRSLRYLTPDSVLAYIATHGLYRDGSV